MYLFGSHIQVAQIDGAVQQQDLQEVLSGDGNPYRPTHADCACRGLYTDSIHGDMDLGNSRQSCAKGRMRALPGWIVECRTDRQPTNSSVHSQLGHKGDALVVAPEVFGGVCEQV